jgi:hypothetical protein
VELAAKRVRVGLEEDPAVDLGEGGGEGGREGGSEPGEGRKGKGGREEGREGRRTCRAMKLFQRTIMTSRAVMAIPWASHSQGWPKVVRERTMGIASRRSKTKRTMVMCAWKRRGSLALVRKEGRAGGRKGGRAGGSVSRRANARIPPKDITPSPSPKPANSALPPFPPSSPSLLT